MSYKLQSVLFERPYFNQEEATSALKTLGGVLRTIDITDNYFRFRQINPTCLRKRGYDEVKTKEISPHIKFIIFHKK
jgi:hypothetical protein